MPSRGMPYLLEYLLGCPTSAGWMPQDAAASPTPLGHVLIPSCNNRMPTPPQHQRKKKTLPNQCFLLLLLVKEETIKNSLPNEWVLRTLTTSTRQGGALRSLNNNKKNTEPQSEGIPYSCVLRLLPLTPDSRFYVPHIDHGEPKKGSTH